METTEWPQGTGLDQLWAAHLPGPRMSLIIGLPISEVLECTESGNFLPYGDL